MKYYVLTDTINEGTVVRVEGPNAECYNAGLDTWDAFPEWLRYIYPGDIYEDLYLELNQQDLVYAINSYKSVWVTYWNFAQSLPRSYYVGLPSPVKGFDYSNYVYSIVDLAQNERERVMLALSGLPLHKDFKQIARDAKLTKPIVEGLRLWHTGTRELWRESNKWVLRPVVAELAYLLQRGDVANMDKIYQRYAVLSTGYTKEQIYVGG